MTHRRLLVVLVLATSSGLGLGAQSPKPTFEVASIKKLDQRVTGLAGFGPAIRGGTMRMTNATLASLIQSGYGLRDFQVVGGPDWLSKNLFELQAKAAGEPSSAEMKLMLQSLLEDRFGLVMHKEQRDMRFFAMIPARGDGRPGPYLHRMPDTGQCDRKEVEEIEKARPKPSTGYAMAGFGCGSLATLAELASRQVELPVFDKTGLTGRWTGMLYFAPNPNMNGGNLIAPPPSAAVTPDPNLPSFSTALQEQLGFKLEQTRGPVEVMVIDSVRQPTEN
jgi:uncharacterized protein (TIGR03435 family)